LSSSAPGRSRATTRSSPARLIRPRGPSSPRRTGVTAGCESKCKHDAAVVRRPREAPGRHEDRCRQSRKRVPDSGIICDLQLFKPSLHHHRMQSQALSYEACLASTAAMPDGSPSRRSWADEADEELPSPGPSALGRRAPSSGNLPALSSATVSPSPTPTRTPTPNPPRRLRLRPGRARLWRLRGDIAGACVAAAAVASGSPLRASWRPRGVLTPCPRTPLVARLLWRTLLVLWPSRTPMASSRSAAADAGAAVLRRGRGRHDRCLPRCRACVPTACPTHTSRRTARTPHVATTASARVTAPSPARISLTWANGAVPRGGAGTVVMSLHVAMADDTDDTAPLQTTRLRGGPFLRAVQHRCPLAALPQPRRIHRMRWPPRRGMLLRSSRWLKRGLCDVTARSWWSSLAPPTCKMLKMRLVWPWSLPWGAAG